MYRRHPTNERHRRGGIAGRLIAIRRRGQADRRGSIVLLSALSLLLLVAASAMALDLTQIYVAKSNVQRIADQSALAAAIAFSQTAAQTTAQNAAQSLATSNGIANASTNVKATFLVNSPKNDGNSAELVTVTAAVPVVPFAKVAFNIPSLNVSASSWAEMKIYANCFIALSSSGITATGGTSLTANGCSVSSGGSTTAGSGAVLTAKEFDAVSGTTALSGGTITTTPTAGNLVPISSAPSDPYNSDGNYDEIFSRLSTVSNLMAPTHTYVTSAASGTNQTCNSGVLNLGAGSATYGSITISGSCAVVVIGGGTGTTTNISYLSVSGWTGTIILGDGIYNIGGVYIGGSGSVTIDDSASTAVINVWNGFNTQSGGSASVTFNGPATYSITGGINAYGNGSITFANVFSSASSTFYVSGGINATHGSLTFPNGYYNITSGGINSVSNNITFGNGSFNIGGGIQYSGGSGSVTFGSALDSNSVFQATSGSNGYAIDTSGGSSLTIGSFSNVDLNGNVDIAGNLTLGAATYTINGTFTAGATGGGTISGSAVSIVTSGAINFAGGFDSISLSAPTTIISSTLGSSSTIVLATESTATTGFYGGTTNTVLAGAIYAPRSQLSLYGGTVLTSNGACTVVDVASATFSGSGSFTTTCTVLSSTTTSSLVQ